MTAPLALTPGEPAGIGPDITLQIVAAGAPAPLVAFADADMLRARAGALGLDVEVVTVAPGAGAMPGGAGQLAVVHVPAPRPVRPGALDPGNAGYVLETLRAAVAAVRAGDCSAMVTGPVHKGVINESGIPFTGHTELLAELDGGARPVMMLCTGSLRVALVTTHLPLASVPAAIRRDRIVETARILAHDLEAHFRIARPRITICGLNPHAGEGGHLGREEIDEIEPAVAMLQDEGLAVRGPLPADTAFTPVQLDATDAVLAMYHDQGLPVIKHAGFGEIVNVTLGLSFVRTSVDHGTALDLAGAGTADASSLREAIRLAGWLAGQRG